MTKVGRRPTLEVLSPSKDFRSCFDARFDASDPRVAARVEIMGG